MRRQTAGAQPRAIVADRNAIGAQAETAAGSAPTHSEIAERAYFLFLDRNGAPGNPADDWARAEFELRRQRGLI
ncbi:MAG: DUF2934 domain-containing protein [Acidobacteriota bacterium]